MDGFYVAKLKKFSNVLPKPKNEHFEVENSTIVVDSSGEKSNEVVSESEDSKKKGGNSQAVTISEESKGNEGSTGKKKKRRKKKKKKVMNSGEMDVSSSALDDSSLGETKAAKNKEHSRKRKLPQEPAEGGESSPLTATHSDTIATESSPFISPSKRRRLRKLKKKLAAGNKLLAGSDKSSILRSPVKETVNKGINNSTVEHENRGPTVVAHKLSKSARRRLKKKNKALESSDDKVVSNLTIQSEAVTRDKKKKKKKRKHNDVNVVDSEMPENSSPNKKLKISEIDHIKRTESHVLNEGKVGVKETKHKQVRVKTPLAKKKQKQQAKENNM